MTLLGSLPQSYSTLVTALEARADAKLMTFTGLHTEKFGRAQGKRQISEKWGASCMHGHLGGSQEIFVFRLSDIASGAFLELRCQC